MSKNRLSFLSISHPGNMEYAGIEILVNSCIAWSFSRQITIGNAGRNSALESMGAKPTFRCNSVNIGLMYKQ